MTTKRWLLRTDFLTGRWVYLAYLLYLAVIFFLVPGAFYVQAAGNALQLVPRPDLFTYSYLFLSVFAVALVCTCFAQTYQKSFLQYLCAVRPSLWQLLYRRLLVLYIALAIPLSAFLAAAFPQMQTRYAEDFAMTANLHPEVTMTAAPFSFPILLVQSLCGLLLFVMSAVFLQALCGNDKIAIMIFIVYAASEMVATRNMLGERGMFAPAFYCDDMTRFFPPYTVLALVLSAVFLLLTSFLTYRRLHHR